MAFNLSKNTALTSLEIHNNQLTSLDLNKNSVLTELDFRGNSFDDNALNALFRSLHSNNITDGWGRQKNILIFYTPGSDQSIATNKG